MTSVYTNPLADEIRSISPAELTSLTRLKDPANLSRLTAAWAYIAGKDNLCPSNTWQESWEWLRTQASLDDIARAMGYNFHRFAPSDRKAYLQAVWLLSTVRNTNPIQGMDSLDLAEQARQAGFWLWAKGETTGKGGKQRFLLLPLEGDHLPARETPLFSREKIQAQIAVTKGIFAEESV